MSQQWRNEASQHANDRQLHQLGEQPTGCGDPDRSKGVPAGLLHLQQPASSVGHPNLFWVQEPKFPLGAPFAYMTRNGQFEKQEL